MWKSPGAHISLSGNKFPKCYSCFSTVKRDAIFTLPSHSYAGFPISMDDRLNFLRYTIVPFYDIFLRHQ